MSPKPTILIVHGSWHTPVHYARLVDRFHATGHEALCPRCPSVGSLAPLGLKDDAQCIRDELARLIEKQGKDVVVIAHSYGGKVTNEAADAGFAKELRRQQGKSGGVSIIIFMVSLLMGNGDGSVGGAEGEELSKQVYQNVLAFLFLSLD